MDFRVTLNVNIPTDDMDKADQLLNEMLNRFAQVSVDDLGVYWEDVDCEEVIYS